MSLKNATLIAVICIILSTIYSLLVTFQIIDATATILKISFILYNGGLILFLLVLYSKQNK